MLTIDNAVTRQSLTITAANSTIVTTTGLPYQTHFYYSSGHIYPGWDASLISYCVSSQSERYQRFQATNTASVTDIDDAVTEDDGYNCAFDNYTAVATTVTDCTHTRYMTEVHLQTFSWNAFSPPCCGTCVVEATSAQLIYWPTPAPNPDIRSIVDEHGFTLYVPLRGNRLLSSGAI